MHRRAQKLFYGLAMFLLMNALFVMSDRGGSEVTALRQEVREELRIAFWQTMSDKPWFEDLEIAVRGIDNFYNQAANEMLVLLEPRPEEDDMNRVIAGLWNSFDISDKPVKSDTTDEGRIAGLMIESKFMQEEPLLNIIPQDETAIRNPELWVEEKNNPSVLGIKTEKFVPPVNDSNEWVTIQDNYTGQLYCLAIYNNEINRYLGPCKLEGNLQ